MKVFYAAIFENSRCFCEHSLVAGNYDVIVRRLADAALRRRSSGVSATLREPEVFEHEGMLFLMLTDSRTEQTKDTARFFCVVEKNEALSKAVNFLTDVAREWLAWRHHQTAASAANEFCIYLKRHMEAFESGMETVKEPAILGIGKVKESSQTSDARTPLLTPSPSSPDAEETRSNSNSSITISESSIDSVLKSSNAYYRSYSDFAKPRSCWQSNWLRFITVLAILIIVYCAVSIFCGGFDLGSCVK